MLSKQQVEAVNSIYGQVMVVSCAGSGKTTLIIERIYNMIKHGINPSDILVITFTKEAAIQMKNRYIQKYGNSLVNFGTIHSLCFSILANELGYSAKDIIQNDEIWTLFKYKLKGKIMVSDMDKFITNLITNISYVRNKQIDPYTFIPESYRKETFIEMYNIYQQYKDEYKKIDFDDMLILCKELLLKNDVILEKWKNKYPYIMIDEFQDTNTIQADIFYMLAGENGNICIVGDDDQSIYRFRSADSSIMLNFPKKYTSCKTIYLDTNYRCDKDIIDKAAKLVKNNKVRFEKNFKAFKKEKGIINVISCKDKRTEAGQLARMIIDYNNKGIAYNDMAILYRTNNENQLPSGALLANKIPFYSVDGFNDYHNDFMFGDIKAYYRQIGRASCRERV